MEFIFIRHGEIDSNLLKIYSGRSQESLNVNGITQAKEVAQNLKHEGISHLYCSPLLRTIETAKIIAAEANLKPIEFGEFNELAMGPWEGMSESDVAKQFPEEWRIWNNTPAELFLLGRESLAQLQQRALGGIKEIFRRSTDAKKICVVSHVAVIRVVILFFEQRDLNQYKKVSIPNATPILLEINEHKLP